MEQRRPCEDNVGDWNETTISQRKPEATRIWKKQGKILPWSLLRKNGLADTLNLDF